jgi:hypothetical protein
LCFAVSLPREQPQDIIPSTLEGVRLGFAGRKVHV